MLFRSTVLLRPPPRRASGMTERPGAGERAPWGFRIVLVLAADVVVEVLAHQVADVGGTAALADRLPVDDDDEGGEEGELDMDDELGDEQDDENEGEAAGEEAEEDGENADEKNDEGDRAQGSQQVAAGDAANSKNAAGQQSSQQDLPQ